MKFIDLRGGKVRARCGERRREGRKGNVIGTLNNGNIVTVHYLRIMVIFTEFIDLRGGKVRARCGERRREGRKGDMIGTLMMFPK
jgi:hypothetical protein